MEEDIRYWVDLAKYDLKTADAMLKSRRYLYVLFTCQQAIEKMLKALVVKVNQEFPPRTHDLLRLAQITRINVSDEQRELLGKLSFYYIETRYPEEVYEISRSISRKIASEYLNRTEEIFTWLRKKM